MTKRWDYLDVLKAFAIVGVILQNGLSSGHKKLILSAFHIGHAVPIFLFVAGITSYISFENSGKSWRKYYIKTFLTALGLLSLYLFFTFLNSEFTQTSFGLKRILLGQVGYGAYFPILFVQHIFFFPLFIYLYEKLNNGDLFLIISLIISAFIESLCVKLEVGYSLNRVLWIRYIFIACLGLYFYKGNEIPRKPFFVLVFISLVFIFMTDYLGVYLPFISSFWTFTHYPAYFYTLFLALLIIKYHEALPFRNCIAFIGKHTYMIFLFQMFFYSAMYPKWINHKVFRIIVAVPICISGGIIFSLLVQKYFQLRFKK